MNKPLHTSRHANKRGAARFAAVQALYQMDVRGTGLRETSQEYECFHLGKEVDGILYRKADAQWFRAILVGVIENQKMIDPLLERFLSDEWSLSRLDSVLRAILRAGTYELIKRLDIPSPVILSEYIDVASAFYTESEPKIVNAVLDRIASEVRSTSSEKREKVEEAL